MLQQSGRLPYENNADKAQGVYKGRKLSLDAAGVLQLCCEKKLGRAIIASRPRHQGVSAYNVLGKQIAGAAISNSEIVLAIAEPVGGNYGAVMSAAWYHKRRPTFSDTLAAVRRHFWQEQGFAMSRHPGEAKKLCPALQEGITYALCHAA